jgi:hypothetical protein
LRCAPRRIATGNRRRCVNDVAGSGRWWVISMGCPFLGVAAGGGGVARRCARMVSAKPIEAIQPPSVGNLSGAGTRERGICPGNVGGAGNRNEPNLVLRIGARKGRKRSGLARLRAGPWDEGPGGRSGGAYCSRCSLASSSLPTSTMEFLPAFFAPNMSRRSASSIRLSASWAS